MDTAATRVQQRIEELAHISDDDKTIFRQYGSPAFLIAAQKIKEWMASAGLDTRIDAAGNIRGKYASDNEQAKIFIIGSHYDTIANAGKYDGALGIITGIEIAAQIIQKNIQLPFHLEIVAFSEGEGVRFHSAYLGSKALAGLFDEQLLYLEDETGITLKVVLEEMDSGFSQLMSEQIPKEEWLGFLDIHIEPGNVLHESLLPVGVGSQIYGNKRIDILFTGEAGHPGTVPFDLRKDALAAASKFVLKVEGYALKDKNNVMATVGRLSVLHATTNVIPATVTCSLDMRSLDNDRLNEAYEELYRICETICHKRNIYFEWKLLQETPPVNCDKKFNALLQKSFYDAKQPYRELVSGATAEASVIHQVAPVAILFLRGAKGISHSPQELVHTGDIEKAIFITEDFIGRLSRTVIQEPAVIA